MQIPGEPLQIDAVSLPSNGSVGMCCCPGRAEFSSAGVRMRDLDRDFETIVRWKPQTVISLIEQHEFSTLGVADLPQRFEAAPFEWFHCPIVDLGSPGNRFEVQFASIEPAVLGLPVTFKVGAIGAPMALPRPVEKMMICAPPAARPVMDSHAAEGVFMTTSPGFDGACE